MWGLEGQLHIAYSELSYLFMSEDSFCLFFHLIASLFGHDQGAYVLLPMSDPSIPSQKHKITIAR